MNYSSRYKSKPIRDKKPQDDNGDFDDMGSKPTESAYHYANKKRLGRF